MVKPLAAAGVVLSLAVTLVSQNAPERRRPAGSDAVVAADGTGDYTTIQAAIDAVPQNTRADRRWRIAVRNGRYREVVYVQREKRFVHLIGEDSGQSVLSFDLRASANGPNGTPMGTFRTPTLQIDADDFTLENLTVENSAGAVGQALAVRVDGDRVIFRKVRLLGWQDTVFLNRGRQYFEDCLISGHVDFIFGGATAFFERCEIHVRGDGYITAASTPPEQPHGFVFANSRITGEPGVHAFLGRPWRDFAAVAFVNTAMDGVVRPEGWNNWDRPEREKSVRYAEGGSTGEGAPAARRVPWARRLSSSEMSALSVSSVLAGSDRWNPQLVIP